MRKINKAFMMEFLTEIPWFYFSMIFALLTLIKLQMAVYRNMDIVSNTKVTLLLSAMMFLIGWITLFIVYQSEQNIKTTIKRYKIDVVR